MKTNWLRFWFTSVLIVFILLLIAVPAVAQGEIEDTSGIPFFKSINEYMEDVIPGTVPRSTVGTALQIATVEMDPRVFNPAELFVGDIIRIDLFDGLSLQAKISSIKPLNRMHTTVALIDGVEFGYMITTVDENNLMLSVIEIPEMNRQYRIVYNHDLQEHILSEYELDKIDKLPEGAQLVLPDMEQLALDLLGEDSQAQQETVVDEYPLSTTPVTVDAMIIYTPAARDWANANDTSINHVINQAVARGQLALNNSNTLINLNLVFNSLINYTEYTGAPYMGAYGYIISGSGVDLERLQLGWGVFSDAHTWRNTYGADIVAMLTKVEDTGGLGYVLSNPTGSPNFAYSINRVQQSSWTYTVIHEMGHNMGAHHHKGQNFQPGPGLWSFSAGWRWISTDTVRYCSIMTYESGTYFSDGQTHTRVAHFSNPNISYIGAPTGNATDGDNARTLRDIRNVIAGYRTVTTLPPRVTLKSPANNANVAGTRVVFNWNAAARATKYQLQVRKVSDNTIFKNLTLGKVTQRAIADFPANGAQYKWRVRAGNAAGWGQWSVYRNFKNPFGAFNHNFNTTNGYQGWIRRPQAVWSLNNTAMLTAGQVDRWVTARRGNVYYRNLDYSVRMRRTNTPGPIYPSIGIVIRAGGKYETNGNWYPSYRFVYTNFGRYSIWRMNPNGSLVELQGWTASNHINKNGWNTLRVRAVNNNLRFFINGNLVMNINDSNLPRGFVGVVAYRDSSTPTSSRFLVDWARLTNPVTSSASGMETMEAIDPVQQALNEAVQAEMAAGRVGTMEGHSFIE